MPDTGTPPTRAAPFTRRRWLQSAAAVTMAAVAGCGGGDGGGDTTTAGTTPGTTEEGPIVDSTLRWHLTEDAPTVSSANLNWWGADSNDDLMRHVYTHTITRSSTHNFDLVPMSVTDWEEDADSDEFRIYVRDDVYWTQGGETIDPFTAGDLETWYELRRYMTPAAERTDNPAVTGWRVEGDDDRELVLELNPDGYNIGAVESAVLTQVVTTYRNGFFGTKVEELKEAASEDERAAVREEIADHEVTLADDPPLCNPWMLTNTTTQRADFEVNEDHWLAQSSTPTPRRLLIKLIGGDARGAYTALDGGDLDISAHMLPDNVGTNDIPDQLQQVSYGTADSITLAMNYGGQIDPYMGVDTDLDREERVAGTQQAKVRQGIAHAIDFAGVLANHFGSRDGSLVDPREKAHPSSVRRVQGDFPELYEQLPSYTATDRELAAQRFEEAGLAEEDGTWTKPDGEPLSMTLHAGSSNPAMMEAISQDLGEFGMDVALDTPDGGVQSLYDDGSYAAVMGRVRDALPAGLEARTHLVDGDAWPRGALPERYEVPPVGEIDAEPSETVDPRELSSAFETEPPGEHAEAVRKMIWTYAYHLPAVPLMPDMGGYAINTGTMSWAVPNSDERLFAPTEDHSPLYGTGVHYVERLGPRGG